MGKRRCPDYLVFIVRGIPRLHLEIFLDLRGEKGDSMIDWDRGVVPSINRVTPREHHPKNFKMVLSNT